MDAVRRLDVLLTETTEQEQDDETESWEIVTSVDCSFNFLVTAVETITSCQSLLALFL